MSTITKSVEVHVPLSTAYNQWTQFETFPSFMEGVVEVQQLDETRLHWVTRVAGVTREFDATVVAQEPDRRVAWRSDAGTDHAGEVTFDQVDADTTRVTAEMTFEPDGFAETVAATLGILGRRVESDLERFREFIEGRGAETGAWRGTVSSTTDPHAHESHAGDGDLSPTGSDTPRGIDPSEPRVYDGQ